MSTSIRLHVALIAIAFICLSPTSHAQGIAPKPLGPNTLSGVVTDDVGRPQADVSVFIASLRRRATTDLDGAFRFDSVKDGTYEIVARATGLIHTPQSVRVGERGGSAYVRLIRVAHSMLSLVTNAERGGLRGVIADTAFNAMEGVAVHVVGEEKGVLTNAVGAFFLPLAPGSYAIQIARDGYVAKRIGIRIDEDSGRKVAAWLAPAHEITDANVLASQLLRARAAKAQRGRGKIYVREDLERLNITALHQLASVAALHDVSPDCPIEIAESGSLIPAWQLTPPDVEYIETFGPAMPAAAASPRQSSVETSTRAAPVSTGSQNCTSVPSGVGRTTTKCTSNNSSISTRPPASVSAATHTPIVAGCTATLVAWLRN